MDSTSSNLLNLQRSEQTGFSIQERERESSCFRDSGTKERKTEKVKNQRQGQLDHLDCWRKSANLPTEKGETDTETKEQREARLQGYTSLIMREWALRLKNRERPGSKGCKPIKLRGGLPRLKNRERSSYREWAVRQWPQRLKNREARLQRMHANQSERLAAKTEEQREARWQRMCVTHTEGIAAHWRTERSQAAEDAHHLWWENSHRY